MAFNAPSLATEENARQVHALRLISALLDGGYSARLPARLERGEELVTSASAWYDAYARGDSRFVLSAAPKMQKGRTLAEAYDGLCQDLDPLKQEPPPPPAHQPFRAPSPPGQAPH